MDIKNVAVVGCGLIGASWAAYFLSKGFTVTAYDPAPDAQAQLDKFVDGFWPTIQQGQAPKASRQRLFFASTVAEAVRNADFIQESGPERLPIKHQLFAEIEAAARPDAIIASSTSGLLISDIQLPAKHPERIVLGHPFNPPHLIPLVEVVGGKLTSSETVQHTLAFYTRIGKKPVHLQPRLKATWLTVCKLHCGARPFIWLNRAWFQ